MNINNGIELNDCTMKISHYIDQDERHTHYVRCIIYFPKQKKLVSSSWDRKIRIWRYSRVTFNFHCEKIIKAHSDYVNHIIIWDSEKGTFLSSSFDKKIKMFSIDPPYKTGKEYTCNKSSIFQLLKIDSERFLSANRSGELIIINHKSKNKLRKLKNQIMFFYSTKLILSKSYQNCFYLNTEDKKKSVKLINYQKNKVVNSFQNHGDDQIYSIICYLDKEDHEILLGGSQAGILYFYKTKNKKEKKKLLRKIKISEYAITTIYSFQIGNNINQKIMLFGDKIGCLRIFSLLEREPLLENSELTLLNNQKQQVHDNDWINAILWDENLSEIDLQLSNTVSFITCSGDKNICSVRVSFQQNERKSRILESLKDDYQVIKSCLLKNMNLLINGKGKTRKEIQLISRTISKSFYDRSEEEEKFKEGIDLQKSWNGLDNLEISFFEFNNDYYYYIGGTTTTTTISNQKEENQEKEEEEENNNNKLIPNGYGILFQKRKRISKSKYYPIYLGDFKESERHGHGEIFDMKTKQKIFEGQFKKNKREGPGKEYKLIKKRSNIIIYEGQFKNDVRHGRGEVFNINSEEYIQGFWKKGELQQNKIFRFKCPIIPYEDIEKYLRASNQIGQGAFGSVYKLKTSLIPSLVAFLPTDQEFVAVKIMRYNRNLEGVCLFQMIKRGIELCRRVNHNNLMKMYGIVQGRKAHGFLMEFLKVSVDKIVNSSLEINEKKKFLYQTASGCKALHKINVMHRDLKWANVMLSNENEIKITDFDTLKEDERRWRLTSIPQTSKIGTPGFVAPEVFLGQKYNLGCDVYAYGLMIYSLLWDLNYPYRNTQLNCHCGNFVENILMSNSLDYHCANCNLRPLLIKSETEKFPKFLIDLMVLCWDQDPLKRPDFKQIVEIFESEEKKLKKFYSIVLLQFPKHIQIIENQKFLLIDAKIKRIKKWIEKKFEGSKVLHLVNKKNGSSIISDEDVFKLIEEDDEPILEVELEFSSKKKQNNGSSNNGTTLTKTFSSQNFGINYIEEHKKKCIENQILREQIEELELEILRLKKIVGVEEKKEEEEEEENEGEN